MKFKIKFFNYTTPIEKSLTIKNENIIFLLLSNGRVDFNIERLFKLQIRTLKVLFKYAGYELSNQKEKKEIDNNQEKLQSNSLPTYNNDESQNIHQMLKELKGNQLYATSKDKNIANNKQIIESLRHFQAEIYDSESSKYLERIEEIGQDQQNKFTKVLMNKFYTLKEIKNGKPRSENIQQLIDEFDIMLTLHHPNILKIHGKFINDENQINPSILLEYCPFNLDQKIKSGNLSKVQQVYWIYQIAEGMKYIHSHKIIHHNLNPSNIFVSEKGTIKIGDFGKAQINETNAKTGEMVDVYSFGSIVYFILSGGKNKENDKEEKTTTITLLARQLINECCSIQPECPPTFETICDLIEKNDFNLISLSQQEIQEAQNLINQHKSLITNDFE